VAVWAKTHWGRTRSYLVYTSHLHPHKAPRPPGPVPVVSRDRAAGGCATPADNPGKWLIEARAVQGDDAGMATWFEVT
jgi:hypothetical protein